MSTGKTISRFLSGRRLRRSRPFFSLVLGVKNGMPVLRDAIDAVQQQTYRRFELLVQDGGSTDGSLEYLRSVKGLQHVDIVSEPDTGIGQAYSRGMARCRGDLACLISCDERLEKDALLKAAGWFSQTPQAAVYYGAVELLDEKGKVRQVFIPPPFDLRGVIHHEIVPPIGATFFNRVVLAGHFYYDESLKTCPDFDFWLRAGTAFEKDRIIMIPDPIVASRTDRTSMSFRVESFDQFCRDRLSILESYLHKHQPSISKQDQNAALASVFLWAAESIIALEGPSSAFLERCAQAAALDPQSARLRRLARQTMAFDVDSMGRFARQGTIQPMVPPPPLEATDGVVKLEEIESFPNWQGAAVESGPPLHVVTGPQPWSYAAQIPVHWPPASAGSAWSWVSVEVEAVTGQIGVGLLVEDCLVDEQLIDARSGVTRVFLRLRNSPAVVMIRNGSLPAPSAARILGCNAVLAPRQETGLASYYRGLS